MYVHVYVKGVSRSGVVLRCLFVEEDEEDLEAMKASFIRIRRFLCYSRDAII